MAHDNCNPYSILKYLLSKKGHTSRVEFAGQYTPRIQAIDFLLEPLKPVRIPFGARHGRFNWEVRAGSWFEGRNTLVLVAHHDTIDPEHCTLDNLGSVSNLIALSYRLSGRNSKFNVLSCIDDGEEVGGLGAKVLAERIHRYEFGKVFGAINLELTARGEKFFLGGNGPLSGHPNFTQVTTPFSDGTVLQINGIPCSTIGTVDEAELDEIAQTGSCWSWDLCHTKEDIFELASEKDMNAFVEFLEKYLTA